MSPLSMPRLVLKRLVDDRMLPVSIFVGIALAATLVAAAPVYIKSLERLALNLEIDKLGGPNSNINVTALVFNIPLTRDRLRETEESLVEAVHRHLSPADKGRERYLIVHTYLAGMPGNPLPEPDSSGPRASRAYFRSYSNLEPHVTFLEGRMARSDVFRDSQGALLEAVISPKTAEMFELGVGDVITLAPDLGAPARLSAQISGIVAAINPTDDYWKPHASIFLDPQPPEGGVEQAQVEFDPAVPPAPLFITQEAMV